MEAVNLKMYNDLEKKRIYNRDENAAKNILTRGLACVRQQTAIEAACVS